MRLETKLGLSTGVLMTAMLLSSLTAHLRTREANLLSTRVVGQRMPLIQQIRDVRMATATSVQALESYMLFGVNEQSAATFATQRRHEIARAEKAQSHLEEFTRGVDLGADGPRVQQVHDDLLRLKTLEQQAEDWNASRNPDLVAKAYMLLQGEVLALENSIYQTAGDISVSQRRQAEREAAELLEANRRTLRTLWIATLLGALIGGLVSILLGRHITQGIGLVAERADAIAAGDLTGNALKLNTRDQVAALAEAMNKMQSSLAGVIGTVVDTAGSLTGNAANMRSASDQIHRRIDQQSQQTQQAATAMQEMSASIAEVSRHTQSAAETARSAAQTARDGGAIVKEMLGSMHSIAGAVSETSATVGLLGEDSRRISQIVTVIDEIARKTNLLALNAAIEAARAGEQGRGFAVVAGEVRRLAESTAQATGEIGAMISEIQERTRSAIASMESGTGTVQQGVVTTTQAGEALERIIGMAERVDRMITQIAIAASQQATAADQSSASLDFIHTLSNDNLTEMATTAAGIETLRGTAVTLEQQVDRFQVIQIHHGRGKAA